SSVPSRATSMAWSNETGFPASECSVPVASSSTNAAAGRSAENVNPGERGRSSIHTRESASSLLPRKEIQMRRHLLVLLITWSLPAISLAGWFTKEEKPSPSREQLIRNEERLTAAQQ